jgi:hypothetical protein
MSSPELVTTEKLSPFKIVVRLPKQVYEAKIRSSTGWSNATFSWEKIDKATQLLYDWKWRFVKSKKWHFK